MISPGLSSAFHPVVAWAQVGVCVEGMDGAEIIAIDIGGYFEEFGGEVAGSVDGHPGDEVGAVNCVAGRSVYGCAGWDGSGIDWGGSVVVIDWETGRSIGASWHGEG